MSGEAMLRKIPKVDSLLASESFVELGEAFPRTELLREVRGVLEGLRAAAIGDRLDSANLEPGAIAGAVRTRLEERLGTYYARVINATGVVLHTGLGRAPLAAAVATRLGDLSRYPQRVEIDLESGERGGRDLGCTRHLEALIGCEAATVVNNNAAATVLILAALARDKEVVLSRGELVEIGGSFRVPDVMRESGAILHEVGTTNRTHEKDYVEAINERTGMLLKVHTSNFKVVGFTREVGIARLIEIGRERGVPVVHDLGSGCLVDLGPSLMGNDQHVRRSVAAGVDLVCFSGDKLLGGPQAGIIVGKKDAVERCRRHPLFRAMRPGRLVYTALEATLRLYLQGADVALAEIPTLRRVTADVDELERRAKALAALLAAVPHLEAKACVCASQAGSGSLPAVDLPSWGVELRTEIGTPTRWASELRTGAPPVLPRIQDEKILLDVRTLDDDEFPLIVDRLSAIAESTSSWGGESAEKSAEKLPEKSPENSKAKRSSA